MANAVEQLQFAILPLEVGFCLLTLGTVADAGEKQRLAIDFDCIKADVNIDEAAICFGVLSLKELRLILQRSLNSLGTFCT